MNAFGFVLLHGYSGRSEDPSPVSRRLDAQFGKGAAGAVNLPGHGEGGPPAFDAIEFGHVIDETIDRFREEGRQIVIIGHSTGGVLALDHLQRRRSVPALLVLAGVPAVIRGSDLERWERHRSNRCAISLSDVARMVSFVNRVTATPVTRRFPVLILQGGADPLVPPAHAQLWREGRFPGSVRSVVIPKAGHDLFAGAVGRQALDCLCRAIADVGAPLSQAEGDATIALQAMDKDVEGFVAAKPASAPHLVRSPAALRALNAPVRFTQRVKTDPIQLNVEITSRCNLSCGHCARSQARRSGRDMDREAFLYLLDLMPNTFKVVLVGLGEPTLHPQLTDFVARATQRGHRVSLVTNAMCLGRNLSRRLVAAGICGLTFSLDSADAELVSRVRRGSDLNRIVANIKHFVQLTGGKIPTAVFTSVSGQTVHRLHSLAAAVADLGVNAWMLSDLNFQWNQSNSLRQNWTPEHQTAIGRAVKLAFARSLPVLSVRGVEEIGLSRRFSEFLIAAPAELGRRSASHRWCLSPWQTLALDVDGNATICDCRPHAPLGNLLERSLSEIWNGAAMQSHRRSMRSNAPPADCLICPRF